ncbi:MAG: hypothetical protein WCJ60_03355 [bacterium]
MKKLNIAQIIALLLTIIIGTILKNNIGSGPRGLHRLFGMLAGLIGLALLVISFVAKAKSSVKFLAMLSFVLTFGAAFSGKSLKTSANYSNTFMMMRFLAVLALVSSTITYFVNKKSN